MVSSNMSEITGVFVNGFWDTGMERESNRITTLTSSKDLWVTGVSTDTFKVTTCDSVSEIWNTDTVLEAENHPIATWV